jgi:hypothetical protein
MLVFALLFLTAVPLVLIMTLRDLSPGEAICLVLGHSKKRWYALSGVQCGRCRVVLHDSH